MKKWFLYKKIYLVLAGTVCISYADSQIRHRADSANNSKLAGNFYSQGKADSLPIKYIQDNTISQGKLSLRNDFPYEQAPYYQQSNALNYPHVRQEDIAYSIRIWEDVDTRKPGNRNMMYAIDDRGSKSLIQIMLEAIRNNQLTAFDAQDDRFTTPLTPQQVRDAVGSGMDTSAILDLDGNITGYQVRNKTIDLDSIYTYRLKEDWFYDKNYGRMMVRIIGIAPVMPFILSTGDIIPNSEHAVFWLYFPDLRSILTKYKAYNMQEPGTKIPFDELFDLGQFKGKIIKSNYENPGEINWNNLMPDPEDQQKTIEEIRKQLSEYGNDNYDMISQETPSKHSKKSKKSK
ncbi:MAG: gliding motility protein GldN [Arachidicoccus sp.]|nr:gliding motility protein GldN [Arachidicoccus sp.]